MGAKLLEVKKGEPNVQNKVIIIGVCVWAIAEEIEVLSDESSSLPILQYHDAILYDAVILLMPKFRSEIDRSEIHQH